jgi:hypothetical protein
MQNADGGWGWFSGFRERSYPHTTAVVVRGLLIAQQNDVPLVPGVLERGVKWLEKYQAEQVRKLKNADGKVKPWKHHADNLDAYAFGVLTDAKRNNRDMLNFLYRDRNHISVFAKAIFAQALYQLEDEQKLAMLLRNLKQYLEIDEENHTAYLDMDGAPYWYWYGSDIEANAYYLKLLSRTDPEGDVPPMLVKYLLNNRKHATYWKSTRDTSLCVEAFADYLRATKELDPEMVVEIWLDGEKQKEVAIDRENLFSFDNRFVLAGKDVADGSHQVEIRRRGRGPVYFNAYLTNFTLEDHIEKTGLEVKVERFYYRLIPEKATAAVVGSRGQARQQAVEKYRRERIANLGKLKSGDLVEIDLKITSKNDYEYLLFEDMKAAGFEPVEVRSGYSENPLGAYMELRDNRVSFFVRQMPRGEYSLSYRMRAETPGRFSALPTRASAMYAPELKGNSDEIKVIIED